MIWNGNGVLKMEDGEPAMRSCWECNGAHEHLKKVNFLHVCFSCGRYWLFGTYMDSFENDEDFDNFFTSLGMNPGDSTQKVDAGYRIIQAEINGITVITDGKETEQ